MKTSNKLLAAFFVLIFAVPFLLLVGFKKAINSQQSTFVPMNNQFAYKGEIKPYKFIKIVGPSIQDTTGISDTEKIFSCTIIPSDSANYSYNYYNSNQQSEAEARIVLDQVDDTLLVKYVRNTEKNYFIPIKIDLYLPLLNEIIVEGATVFIDSINTTNSPQISFDLRNHANLQLGNFGHSQTILGSGNIETEVNGTKNIHFDSSYFRERSGKLLSVHIKASNASFTVGPYAWINHLQLQINGQSQVSIDNNSRIDQLSGFISDSSSVNADWKNIRRLTALTTK